MRGILDRARQSSIARGRAFDFGKANVLGIILLLMGVIPLYAQGRTTTPSLVLQVRPEVRLRAGIVGLEVKIRLAHGATARLWAANACGSPAADSFVIAASGSYTIPYNALPTATPNPNPSVHEICLTSSDGTLNDSTPVESAAIQSGGYIYVYNEPGQGATF